jgi:hypothetical protein
VVCLPPPFLAGLADVGCDFFLLKR